MRERGLIAASIAACDMGRLREEVKDLNAAGVDLIHVDIMDGVFVPNITFGPWILEVIRSVSSIPVDCHLMVSRPGDWISQLAGAGADRITVHIESSPHVHRLVAAVKKLGKQAGVSFNPGHPVVLVEELLDWVDVIQVMSVDPGFSGQKFIGNAIGKISELDHLRGKRNYQIEIDGGVHSENINAVREAGADIFVLGSEIFSKQDKKLLMAELKRKVSDSHTTIETNL